MSSNTNIIVFENPDSNSRISLHNNGEKNPQIPNREIFQYIRLPNGIKTGVILGIYQPNCISLYAIGVAQFNPKKYPCDRERLLNIARGRAIKNPIESSNDGRLTEPTRKLFPVFEERCRKYFKSSR